MHNFPEDFLEDYPEPCWNEREPAYRMQELSQLTTQAVDEFESMEPAEWRRAVKNLCIYLAASAQSVLASE